jgi:hypothetical protein
MPTQRQFSGEIVVSSRIVDYLSSGLYATPAACLKELINNSYDADATLAEVLVKPDADRIIIADDGDGMNANDFRRHFSRISESRKRVETDVTRLGRPKIGRVGIGFIAANEICDEMEIFSTQLGSRELLHVTVQFAGMRQGIDARRRGESDIAKADYEGTIEEAEPGEHFTRIFLKSVRGEARKTLAGAQPPTPTARHRSLYGLAPTSVREVLADPKLSSWSEFDEYSQTLLRIALNVPVGYHEGWLPSRLLPVARKYAQAVARLGFSVKYDGSDLRRPIVLLPRVASPIAHSCFARRFHYRGDHVAADGYFYVQHGTIKPEELQGLLLRIRHAAVGEYRSAFLQFPATEGSLIQRWISAEIWADDRLEEAMNIDRRTLRTAHPAYAELRRALHTKLREVIAEARRALYESGRTERRAAKAAKTTARLREIVMRDVAPVSSALASAISKSLDIAEENPSRHLLTSGLSASELYGIVVATARKLLPPALFKKLLQHLNDQLIR